MKFINQILFIIYFLTIQNIFSQNVQKYPSAQILTKVFPVKLVKSGTSFFIQDKGKEYLITARYLLSKKQNSLSTDEKSGDDILFKLEVNRQLLNLNGKVYFHENDSLDIALIKITSKFEQPYENSYYSI